MSEGFPQDEYIEEESIPIPPVVEDVSSVGNLSAAERAELSDLIRKVREG